MGSTVTTDPVFLDPRSVVGPAYKVTSVPSADAEFCAAVCAAVSAADAGDAGDAGDPSPISEIEERLHGRYPSAALVERHELAGFGKTRAWYALRDGRATPRARRRILIVDDDPSMTDVIVDVIDGRRFEIRSVADGRAALEAIEGWPPDLILLDLLLPTMSGDDFADRYRELPGAQAPLVVLSGAFDAAERAARMHARSVVSKPCDIAALVALVDRYA
jgi:CheY-like chemotaxis protein